MRAFFSPAKDNVVQKMHGTENAKHSVNSKISRV